MKTQHCENCDAVLNDQCGFENTVGCWCCTECGTLNYVYDYQDDSADEEPTLLGNIAGITSNVADLAESLSAIHRTFHPAEEEKEEEEASCEAEPCEMEPRTGNKEAKPSIPSYTPPTRQTVAIPEVHLSLNQTLAIVGAGLFLLMAAAICPDELTRFFTSLGDTILALATVILKVIKGLVDFVVTVIGRICSMVIP